MKSLALILVTLTSFHASAMSFGSWFVDPNVGVGFNTVQGTVFRLGVDVGAHLDENFYVGLGGYVAAGDHQEHDRELGVGPFVGYAFPVASFLTLNLREDIDYIDARDPVKTGNPPEVTDHTEVYGTVSATTASAHVHFSSNWGFSVGYRAEVALNNSAVAHGRSGLILGISIGF